jgi:hypothetical protein
MKVGPYHTDSPAYPPEQRTVYHDHDDCPDGKTIKSPHLVLGTRGKPRCEKCTKLG